MMWSGYCSSHGNAGGYNKLCTNQTEWDTMDGVVSVATDGTFTVNEPGYYRINSFVISNGSGYAYARMVVNGQYKHHGHEYVHSNTWSDNFVDLIWYMESGDTFFVEYNNPGQYAYHSGNSNGAYNRLQVHFLGN